MEPFTMEHAQKFIAAYNIRTRSISKELGLTQTGFDILMFFANNPSYHTARDIVEIRRIKANLVSVNVEKLVQEGYLLRKQIAGDRRKVGLYLTQKAQPIVQKGHQAQEAFFQSIFAGVSESQKALLLEISNLMARNIDQMIAEGEPKE